MWIVHEQLYLRPASKIKAPLLSSLLPTIRCTRICCIVSYTATQVVALQLQVETSFELILALVIFMHTFLTIALHALVESKAFGYCNTHRSALE